MSKNIRITIISISIAIIAIATALIASACGNRQILDLNYSFKYAIIDGVGEVEISSWTDYEGSDMIQVTGKDGCTYLTHSSKVILKSK